MRRSVGIVIRVPPANAGHVWALGELLECLRAYLIDGVRIAQSGTVFAGAADKFVKAFECWCQEVESAVGPLTWARLTETEARQLEQRPSAAQAATAR